MLLLAGACATAGCTPFGPGERASLERAAQDYARNDPASAAAVLDPLITNFGSAPEIAEAYYLRGLCRVKQGQEAAAVQDFNQALAVSQRKDVTAHCQASLAAIAYRHGDWQKAAELYDKSTARLPDSPPTDEILYCAGIAMQRAGLWAQARAQFGRIRFRFKNRPVAADAGRLAAWQHPYHAIQLGAFRSVTNAQKAMQEFQAQGLADVTMENHPRGGEALWVVMTGQHPTYTQAVAAMTNVQRVQPDAYIIPRP